MLLRSKGVLLLAIIVGWRPHQYHHQHHQHLVDDDTVAVSVVVSGLAFGSRSGLFDAAIASVELPFPFPFLPFLSSLLGY